MTIDLDLVPLVEPLRSTSSDDDLDSSGILVKGNSSNDLESEESALHEFDFLTGEPTSTTTTTNSDEPPSKSAGQ